MPYKLYWDGLKFGMFLQLAVGSMCLMVFSTAKSRLLGGLFFGAIHYAGRRLLCRIGSTGSQQTAGETISKKAFRYIGGGVLLLFGPNTLLGAFGISLIPGADLQVNSASIFLQGLLLTLSNPITIVFGGSVLTGKIVEDDLKKTELTVFSVGLISATLFFLPTAAGLGTILISFLPDAVSKGLNILVGLLIIFFGVKMLVKKMLVKKRKVIYQKESHPTSTQSGFFFALLGAKVFADLKCSQFYLPMVFSVYCFFTYFSNI